MYLYPTVQILIPVLLLASPALSCVQFSIDYTCPGTSKCLHSCAR